MERIAEVNRRLALTDPLTGLPNRRHLELYLDRLLADGGGHPFSLAVFDVDDFKGFNHRRGYAAGDRVLAAVGTVVSRACGYAHFAARLGGDEFVVVFTGEQPGRARGAADRMARSVARYPSLSSRGITVSFGLAAMDAGMWRWQDLLAAADRDLRRRRSAARPLPADRGFR